MATCDRLWAYVGTGAAGGRVKCGCARAFASRALDTGFCIIGELASPIIRTGPQNADDYQSASPDLDKLVHIWIHAAVISRSAFVISFCLLYLAIPVCIVIMYAFPQGYPSNLSLTFNLELYTSICEAD